MSPGVHRGTGASSRSPWPERSERNKGCTRRDGCSPYGSEPFPGGPESILTSIIDAGAVFRGGRKGRLAKYTIRSRRLEWFGRFARIVTGGGYFLASSFAIARSMRRLLSFGGTTAGTGCGDWQASRNARNHARELHQRPPTFRALRRASRLSGPGGAISRALLDGGGCHSAQAGGERGRKGATVSSNSLRE
jgi:hypothetical protein